MKYTKGQKVKIHDSDNNVVDGTIVDVVEMDQEDEYYWVQFLDKDGTIRAEVATDKSIEQCYSAYTNCKCTCGSDACGHPSHSSWCDKNKVKTEFEDYFPWND